MFRGLFVAYDLSGGVVAASPNAQYNLLKEFKSQLKAKIKHQPKSSVHLEHFPARPDDLPDELWKQAYGESPEEDDKLPMGAAALATGAV